MVIVGLIALCLITAIIIKWLRSRLERHREQSRTRVAAAAAAATDAGRRKELRRRISGIPTMTFTESMRAGTPERQSSCESHTSVTISAGIYLAQERAEEGIGPSAPPGVAVDPLVLSEATGEGKQLVALRLGAFRAARTCSGGGTCSICLVEFGASDVVKQLPCRHVFHGCCLDEWLHRDHVSCPYCRRDIFDKDISEKNPEVPQQTAPPWLHGHSSGVEVESEIVGREEL